MAIRILIADDHEGVRSAASRRIQTACDGWEVYEAEDGQAAIDKAVAAKPDLVILDVRMPRLDGLSAGRVIRRLLPAVPILIYTLTTTPYLEAEAKNSGFQGLVEKTNGAELIAAIRNALLSKISAPEVADGRTDASEKPGPPLRAKSAAAGPDHSSDGPGPRTR